MKTQSGRVCELREAKGSRLTFFIEQTAKLTTCKRVARTTDNSCMSRVHCFPLPRKKFGTQATTIPLTVKCYDKTVTVAKGTVKDCP